MFSTCLHLKPPPLRALLPAEVDRRTRRRRSHWQGQSLVYGHEIFYNFDYGFPPNEKVVHPATTQWYPQAGIG